MADSHIYTEKIIVFIDILGFKDKIHQTRDKRNGEPCDPKLAQGIKNIFDFIQQYIEANHTAVRVGDEVWNFYGFQSVHFSDCLVLTMKTVDFDSLKWLFDILISLNAAMVHSGVLLRGAITRGKVFHEGNQIFGPGMVDAYTLESKCAIFPRIILDPKVVAAVKVEDDLESTTRQPRIEDLYLSQDSDSYYFIDYIKKSIPIRETHIDELEKLTSAIYEIIKKDGQHKDVAVVHKMRWLGTHYNLLVDDIQKYLKIHKSAYDSSYIDRLKNIRGVALFQPNEK